MPRALASVVMLLAVSCAWSSKQTRVDPMTGGTQCTVSSTGVVGDELALGLGLAGLLAGLGAAVFVESSCVGDDEDHGLACRPFGYLLLVVPLAGGGLAFTVPSATSLAVTRDCPTRP